MLKDLRDDRIKKLDLLKEASVDPYPASTKRTHSIREVLEEFSALSKARKKISVVGRATSVRDQGNLIFIDIRDDSGKMQVVMKKDNVKSYALIKETLDRGDFISATGTVFTTKKGERSVEAKELHILTKSLLPIPTDFYGLSDQETILRKRYLDMLINPEVKEMIRAKFIFWEAFRQQLMDAGFLEVQTPVLELLPGGAEAEPFVTHHNALDQDFYLRISLELPLKKLLVGGFERVFEIGRVFRNEGIDREHLQDYTALEFYWAYHDYNDLMKFLEPMYKNVVKAVAGVLTTKFGDTKINWGSKWEKIEYCAIFKKTAGLDALSASDDELLKKAISLGADVQRGAGRGRLIDAIFKKTTRPKLIKPCFLINPPVEIEPLAKRSSKDPRLVERLQIVAAGTELGKGFSELNDPLDQRGRFEEQMKLRERGDQEAQHLDEDFLEALEYGMPPATGFGVSERLFAILMDKPIRETVIFPLVKPQK